MKQVQDGPRTWSGTHHTKDFEISPDLKERKKRSTSQQRHSKRVKSCLTYMLVAATTALALILVIVVLDNGGKNPVSVYFQGVLPSRTEELPKSGFQKGLADGHSFIEKGANSGYREAPGSEYPFGQMPDSTGQYQSVMELYMNRLFVTPLNKMSLTIPISDEVLRNYQVEAIDYSIHDDMVLYLSLGHQLKINNETMVLYDESMHKIVHFPTYGDEGEKENGQDGSVESGSETGPIEQSKLRNSENKRRLQQHEYYNYTSTSEWSHKPEVVNNIIPTYYPRNPYVPPYGNPYYFSPNILVPYVYIY